MNNYSNLIKSAVDIREKAYAPYSKYKVGVAILAKSGKIYCGANVENAIYRGTHAEKLALDIAVLNGEREFVAIAVATIDDETFPCGQCLQDLTEFDDGTGSLIVIAVNAKKKSSKSLTLAELYPKRFGPKNLGINVKKH